MKNRTQNMTVFEHIHDLRKHVVRALLWVLLSSTASFIFMSQIINFLKGPYHTFTRTSQMQFGSNALTSINVFEVMTINLKICFLIGLCFSCPFVLFEIWKYVRSALYPSEKRFAKILIISIIFL